MIEQDPVRLERAAAAVHRAMWSGGDDWPCTDGSHMDDCAGYCRELARAAVEAADRGPVPLNGAELHGHLETVHAVLAGTIDSHTDEQLREKHAMDHAERRWGHSHETEGYPAYEGVGR